MKEREDHPKRGSPPPPQRGDEAPPFRRVFLACRGEIAVRIARTCRRLGIETVAAVVEDETAAYHARAADRAVPVTSYLDGPALVAAATDAGADAVHPGYGFLAERPDFAAAVETAGLVWVGPSPHAMALAADKLEARRAAAGAGVPVLPSGEPEELGFPLILKAAGGGGGRGMRVVRSREELEDALAAARREAGAAFGDERIYAEAYLQGARHVEVQILGDGAGGVVTLGERDCSVQRRHQKVLEESPSTGLDAEAREGLAGAATALSRAIGYANAGTVEFLVAGEELHFIELNARLQVEHPVTELRYGLDLVEAQLRIAAGRGLPAPGEPAGHAIEARLYAEDPLHFLPRGGRIERLELPSGLRVDAGVEPGDEVPLRYDPLLAKLVAHGDAREEALARLAAGLAQTRVEGVTTNLGFLRWLVSHPVVRAGAATTTFLEEHPPLSRRRLPGRPWAGHWRLGGGAAVPPPSAPPTARAGHAHRAGTSALESPMPGLVLRVLVAEGDEVETHEPLVLLEAMKMETPIVAPYPATVRRLLVAEGERVDAGTPVAELDG